ncbi:2800_t:CDS:10, partial [Racocetra persica]
RIYALKDVKMQLSSECFSALKAKDFWRRTDRPSLQKFIEFRFQEGGVEDKGTEYSQYKSDLYVIKNHYSETTEVGEQVDKKSRFINVLWDLQMERQVIQDKTQLQQNELNNQINLERVSNAYLDIRNQDHLLRKITTKQIEGLAEYVTGQKRSCEEESSSVPPSKVRTISTEMESTHNDLIFEGESPVPLTNVSFDSCLESCVHDQEETEEILSTIINENEDIVYSTNKIPLTNDSSGIFAQTSFSFDQEPDAETTPPVIINEDGDVVTNKRMMCEAYLKIRQEIHNLPSQKDVEWRASVRQPKQLVPPFFGEMMDEYEREINDIDELRSKFYNMWGRYYDRVIYSDNERCLFEATQVVAHSLMHMYPDSKKRNEDTVVHDYIHDIFKEIFCDPDYDIIWANIESLSSKSHCTTYGRSQGRRPDVTLYRIMENDNLEGGINNIISLRGNELEVKSFCGHICRGYIYFEMMDLEYDGIYCYFQLSEIKLAQKLSEFNL